MQRELSKAEMELREVTGVKSKKGEDRQNFLARLLQKSQDLENDAWEDLTEAAQRWVNEATKADNDDSEIPDFDALDEDGEDEEEGEDKKSTKKAGTKKKGKANDEDEEDDGGKSSKRKRSRSDDDEGEEDSSSGDEEDGDEEDNEEEEAMASKKAAAKKGGKAKTKEKEATKTKSAPKSAKGASMRRTLKQIVVKNPKITVDDLVEKLEDKGFKPSKVTVGSIRADTRDTMTILVDAGMLDANL